MRSFVRLTFCGWHDVLRLIAMPAASVEYLCCFLQHQPLRPSHNCLISSQCCFYGRIAKCPRFAARGRRCS
jgi:hypothetical protein